LLDNPRETYARLRDLPAGEDRERREKEAS
jgi:hypothetical protein